MGIFAEWFILQQFLLEATSGVHHAGIRNIDFLKFSEETLTETLLMNLTAKYSSGVKVMTFNRRVESRITGADWAWIFRTTSGPVQMLVQAKRISDHVCSPRSEWKIMLPSKKNKVSGKTQHQTFLECAQKIKFEPFYCIYSLSPRLSWCKNLASKEPFSLWSKDFGPVSTIHLCPANALSEGEVKIDAILSKSKSFADLMCCHYQPHSVEYRLPNNNPWLPFEYDFLEKDPDRGFDDIVEELNEYSSIAGVAEFNVRD